MSESQQIDVLYELAEAQIERGNTAGAIDALTQLLGQAPDEPRAHALLALALVNQKRLHAAKHEASLALAASPDDPLAHYVLGRVAVLQRRPKDAERHYQDALALDPDATFVLRAMADLRLLQERRAEALKLLEEALASDPNDPSTMADLGDLHRREGRLDEGERLAREALAISPEHQQALVLMGRILLEHGHLEEAREHALWALRQDPTDIQTLHFVAELKARTNPLLGLWWRYSVWMQRLGETRQLLVVLGTWLLYRISTQGANDLGAAGLATAMQVVWIAFVAYTWVGPSWFERAVRKELEPVRLRPS